MQPGDEHWAELLARLDRLERLVERNDADARKTAIEAAQAAAVQVTAENTRATQSMRQDLMRRQELDRKRVADLYAKVEELSAQIIAVTASVNKLATARLTALGTSALILASLIVIGIKALGGLMIVKKRAIAGVAAVLATASLGGALVATQLIGTSAAPVTAFRQINPTEYVPFLGPFAQNKDFGRVCGPAVRIMEGALRNTKPPIRKAPAANCVGKATTHQIKVFQSRHSIPQSGIYGHRTHLALVPRYTKEQRLDLIYLQRRKLDTLRRQTIGVVTSHAYEQRAQMGYCDFGSLSSCERRAQWPPWPGVPKHTDCSGYVSWVLFQSGVPNPNGVGVGNTTSLVKHGSRISINSKLLVGDLIFYGYNNSHVAVYIGHGLVSSHGQPGIHIHPYGYRPIYAIRRYF